MLDYVIASEWNGRAARKEDLREIERVSGNGTRLSSFYAILNYFCLLNFETKFSPENNPKVVLHRISFHKEKSSSCRPQAQSRRVRSERKAVLYEKLEQALAFPWTPLFPRGFHRIETEKPREREKRNKRFASSMSAIEPRATREMICGLFAAPTFNSGYRAYLLSPGREKFMRAQIIVSFARSI